MYVYGIILFFFNMSNCLFVMCFFIFMFCYIVVDIDNLFYGFFRIEFKSVLIILENFVVCFYEEVMIDIKVEYI